MTVPNGVLWTIAVICGLAIISNITSALADGFAEHFATADNYYNLGRWMGLGIAVFGLISAGTTLRRRAAESTSDDESEPMV